MAKFTVVVVEDEIAIARLIELNLRNDYDVKVFHSGEDFFLALPNFTFDLLLLDIMLPGIDGIEILRRVKQNERLSNIPVIMLTAKGEEIDKVLGLEMGADDYMTKPFSVRELTARVKALLRRSTYSVAERVDVYNIGNVKLDKNTHAVTVEAHDLTLSRKEFQILEVLMAQPDWVVSRDTLLDKVWGYSYDGGTRTVDVHMAGIRKKLDSAGATMNIETVFGCGYKLSKGV